MFNYYVTTLMNAFKTLGPPILFLVVGWFIFVKLPFLFLRKNLAEQKKKIMEENRELQTPDEEYTIPPESPSLRVVNANGEFEEPRRKLGDLTDAFALARKSERQRTNSRKAEHIKPEPKAGPEKTSQGTGPGARKTETKKEGPKATPKKNLAPASPTPEQIFNLRPNETLTALELKRRYFELLKKNHPDRVASMGDEFRKLAEKNTKDINKAFEALKKKAS